MSIFFLYPSITSSLIASSWLVLSFFGISACIPELAHCQEKNYWWTHMNFCFAVPKGLEHVACEDVLQNIGDVGTFTTIKGSGFVFLACNPASDHVHTAIKISNANLLGVESCYIVLGVSSMPRSIYEDTDTERFLDWIEESVQDKAIFVWKECLVAMQHLVPSLSNHVPTNEKPKIVTETKDLVKFRASFEKNNHKHTLASQNIAGAIGEGVLDLFRGRWRVDLKHYDLEIFGTWFLATTGITSTLESSPFLSQSTGSSLSPPDTCDLLFLLAITIPMAHNQASNYRNRIAFGRTAMRPTIAHCLVRMANPQPGDIVLDPCCGVGTIPIEGAYAYPNSLFIGSEVYGPAVCESARANVRHAKLYPVLIKELYRVLRPCGRALLVTQGHKVMNRVLEEQWCANMFNLERKLEMTIGYKVYFFRLRTPNMYKSGPRYPNSTPKASSSTQCQRCLEYGHWTYECKKPRSYKARPTRTQQLSKPLKSMTPELPPEFLDKKGLAEKILKEKEQERKRQKKGSPLSSGSDSDSDSGSESSSGKSRSDSDSKESSSSSSSSESKSDSNSDSDSESRSDTGSDSDSIGSSSSRDRNNKKRRRDRR
ncbi:hypothetical protein BC937DRAFT_92708 [Endogone sp. FLAS-F59071]|nr:hypothetical protein BC937DRAFT_92708 [Endogone sp. FLAS-F59071]|eukprot:RUS21428.1 hypothetical protein BC937DRAFT_92708 [Endogone sp. FLAS-F59071]